MTTNIQNCNGIKIINIGNLHCLQKLISWMQHNLRIVYLDIVIYGAVLIEFVYIVEWVLLYYINVMRDGNSNQTPVMMMTMMLMITVKM